MSSLAEFNEHMADLYYDPEKEDNWSHVEKFLGNKDEIEDLEGARAEMKTRIERFEKNEGWEHVARLTELLIDLEEDNEVKADLLLKVGKLYDDELFDGQAARRAFEETLRLRQGDENATEALSKLKAVKDGWRDVVERYLQEVKDTQDAAYKSQLYLQIAALYMKFGGKPKAKLKDVLHYLQLALESDPTHRQAVRFLRRLLIKKKQWDEVVSLYQRLAEIAKTKEDKVEALAEQARILAMRMDKGANAAELYEQVLSLHSGHKGAMTFLVNHYTTTGENDNVIKIYESILKSRPGREDEIAALLQIAMVFWRVKGEMDKAGDYFKRIKRVVPGHPAALNFYREYYSQSGDWMRLVQTLNETVRAIKSPEESVKIYREIADISENRLNNVERAIDAYKAILKVMPGDEGAVAILKQRYKETQKWNALLDILKSQVAAAKDDPPLKIGFLKEIAGIYRDRLSLDVMVLKTFHQILDIDPMEEESLSALVSIYEKGEKWNDLAALYDKRLEVEEDRDSQIGYLKKIGDIWMNRLSNFNRATVPLERILELEPDNREVLGNLKGIYQQRRMWEPLFALYKKEVELLPEEERMEKRKEMAKLSWEKLGQVDEATKIFWQILENEPDSIETMQQLEKLCERGKDWEGLAKILRMQSGIDDTPDGKAAKLLKWGNIVSEKLGDLEVAEQAWRELLAIKPGHPKALNSLRELYIGGAEWGKLTEMYSQAGNWDGLAEVFMASADKLKEKDEMIHLLLKAAEIYESKVDNPAKAHRCYEKILAADPENRRAAESLLPIYEKEGNYRKQVDIQTSLLASAETEAERVEKLKQLINLYGEKIGSPEDAFKMVLQAHKLAPDDPDVKNAVDFYGDRIAAWEELIEIYRERINGLSGDEKLEYQRRLAYCLYRKAGRMDEALTVFESILETNPDDAEAYEAIEEILKTTARLDQLVKLYEGRFERVESDEAKAEMLKKMAMIAQEGLDDAQAAAGYYRKLLEYQPEDNQSIGELETLYRISEQWDELVDVLNRKRSFVDGEELVDTVCEVAEIYAVNLENHAKALEEVEFVLNKRPADRKAVGILEKLLKKDDQRIAAARLIEPHLKPLEKYSQYAWVLQILLEAAEDPEEKLTLFESLAMVHDENLSDTAAAYDTVSRALDEFPSSEKLWDRIEQLAERSDRWEDGCRKFEELFSNENLDEDVRVSLARRLAVIGEQKTGDLDAARKYHKWIFDRNKEDQAAFEALEMIHTNQDRYAELRNLYREKADVTPDAEAKVELLQKIGFINEDMIENRKDAIEIYREIMGLMPAHENANKSLERLYEQESMWAELADHIEANLDHVPPEASVAAKFKLADIVDTKLLDCARAVAYYRQVLDDHPTHLKAQEALVKFLSMEDMKFEAARILEPIYDSQGVYGQLINVLGVRFEGAQTDDDKIDILLKMSDVQEKRLKDSDGSFETLSRAFDIDPSREETVTRIESLVESSNYWSIYVDVLEEAAGKTEDSLLKGGMLFKVARIYEERLEDMEKAEIAFKKYLDLDLDDREMILASAASLEKIYAAGERHEELIGMLKLQVEHNETPGAGLELLKRIAEIQESLLSRSEDAIRTNIEILEIAPEDFGAITSLRRLYETTQQWEELVSILKKMIDVAQETEEKKMLQYEVASFYAQKLENAEEAIFTYQLIGEEFGEEIEALNALVKLYEKTEDWAELTATVERLIGLSEADSEKIALLLYAGNIEKDKMDDLDAAAARCQRVLDLDADNRQSLKILEELLSKDTVRLKVAQVLGPIYEKNQQFEQLIGILDIEIGEEQDFDRKVSLQRRVAEISEIGLGDMDRAFTSYADALRGRLDNVEEAEAIIDDLERITRDGENFKRLVDFYCQVAPDILDEKLQLKVYLTVAETYHRQLGDLDAAKDWYTKVLDIAPSTMHAVGSLEEIYSQTGDYLRLIEVLKMKTDISEDEAEKVNLLFSQAQLSEEKLQDEAASIDAYEAILEIEESREAVTALERLYKSTGRWGNYRDILERQLEWPDEDAVDLHHRLGLTFYENLGDPDGALEHFRQALGMRQDYQPTIDILESWLSEITFREQVADILEPIYLGSLQFDKLLSIMEVKIESTGDPDLRQDIYFRMGKIYEEQLEDLEKAFSVYVRMLKEDVENKDVRQNIDRLANVLDIWPMAAEAYKGVLEDVISDTPGTADLWYHLGMIQDTYCDDPDSAIDSLKRALSFDPSDKRVFMALEGILQRDEKWAQELYDLYRDSVDAQPEESERKKMMHVMGKLSEEKLGDRQQAIEIWREVIASDPNDETATAALERLYFYEKKFPDLADLLMERIDRARNAFQQLELKHKLAGIYCEHLEDVDAAVDLYEQVLSQDSAYQDSIIALESMMEDEERQRRVAEILIPIYREHGKWEKLTKAYEIELNYLEDPMDRKQRFIEIGNLEEETAGDNESAFNAFSSAFKEDPADNDLLDKILELAERTENWETLAAALDEAAGITDMPSIQSLLYRQEARVLDRRMGDFRSSVDVYKKLLEIEEGDNEALDALDSLYTLLADWEGLLWALDTKASFTVGQEGLLMVRRREGEICEDQIGDIERAVTYYTKALEVEPSDFNTISSLERLYESTEQWPELVSLLQNKVSYLSDNIEKRKTQLKIASIQKERLANVDEAIITYNSILDDFPEDIEVMRVLDDLLAKETRWEEYYENLEKRAKVTFDEEELRQILLKMGEVLQAEIMDVDRAIETYRKVLEISDSEEACKALEVVAGNEDYRQTVIHILEPIYRRSGDWEKLLNLYRLRLEIMSDPNDRAQALVQIADLQEQGIADKEGAFATCLEALKEEVWVEDIYTKTEILAEELGKYKTLAETLEEKVTNLFDTAVAAELNMRIGRMWEERVDSPDRAIESYKRILDQGVDEREALNALERLQRGAENWKELLDIYERKLAVETDESAKAALLLQMAHVRLEKTDDISGAVSSLSAVLRSYPDNAQAVEFLEGLLDRGEMVDEIMSILQDTYRAVGNLRKLVDLLDLKARRAVSVDEKVEILREEALVAEEDLQDPDTAMRALLRALWEMPEDTGLLDDLERLCEVLGAWETLATNLSKIIDEREPSEDTKRDMSLRIARWSRTNIKDHKSAAAWYEKYLAGDSDNVEVLEEYEEELFEIKDYVKLLDVMEKRESLEYDVEKKKQLLYSLADLSLKETGQPDRAAEAYEKVFALDDSNVEVIDLLIDLKSEREDWDRVIELIERRIDYTPDHEEAAKYRFRLASLMTEVKKDDDRAIEIYREILDIDPENGSAVEWIEHLYDKTQKWFEMKDLYIDRVDRTAEPEAQLAFLLKLAGLLESKIEDVDGAIDYLMRAYEINPASADVISSLERLLSVSGRLEDLIDLLRKRAEQLEESDPESHLELLVRIGEIYFRSLDSPDMAVEYYERVLEADAENASALAALAAIYESNEEWPKCISALDRAAGGTKDLQEMGNIFFKIGTIKREKVDDLDGALEAYNAVLEVNPDHPQILDTLLDYFTQREDWGRYASVLELKLQKAEERSEKVDVLLRIAGVLKEKLDDSVRSLAYVEQAHDINPEDLKIKKMLIDAYLDAGDNDRAAEVIEKLIAAERQKGLKRSKDLSVYLHLLGRVYEQRGQIDDAIAKYEEANKADLSNFAVNFNLGLLYDQKGESDKAMKILRPLLLQNLEGTGIEKAEVYYILGRIHAAKGEKQKAVNMLDRALSAKSGHAEAKALLDEVKSR